jgi:SRSO17 transposase
MPVVPVPGSFAALLFLLSPAFTAPSFETFSCLVVGFLARVGERTVTGMLQAARLERVWHHSRAHAFFAERKWSPDRLGLLLMDFLVERFLSAGEPIVLAVDDTLFKRRGKKVYGAAWQYDGSLPAGAGSQTGYGNNWVVMALVVRLPVTGRAVSLPVLFRLWQPNRKPKRADQAATARKPDPRYPSKPELARRLLDLVIRRYPGRQIELLGDSAYATQHLRGQPERVSVTSRLRSNAALYAPKPPPTGDRGRPANKGARLPTLQATENNPATVWEQVEVTRSGKRQTVLCHTYEALWYDVWRQRPVRVALVKRPGRNDGYDIALVTTNIRADAQQMIERYAQRWSIEVCFEDARQTTGVGEARNRVKNAVERTVPFGLLCQTLTITWYALHGHAEDDVRRRRLSAPWYRHKRSPSYHDMLASLRRELIITQYRAVTGTAPQPQQTGQPPRQLKAAAA